MEQQHYYESAKEKYTKAQVLWEILFAFSLILSLLFIAISH